MPDLKHFKFWCYKVLPLVYDDSLSYYEVLCKVVDYINKLIDQDQIFADEIEGIKSDIASIQYWIDHFTDEEGQAVADRALAIVIDNIYAIRSYRNIVCIGDSYGTADGGSVTIDNPFPVVLQSYLGISNDNFHYRFGNGAGFGNGHFTSLLNTLIQSMSDKSDVTDVYFFGGWNDEANRVSSSEFLAGVTACENLINTNFPHAIKHVVFWSNSKREWSQNLWTTRNWYKGLATRGWATHNNIGYVLIDPSLYISDGAHPNQDGVNALAKASAEMIIKGDADVHFRFFIPISNLTAVDDVVTNAGAIAGNIVITVQNDTSELCLNTSANNLLFKFQTGGEDAPRTITFNGTEIKVAELPEYTLAGATVNCGITLPCWIHKADDSGETIGIRVIFRNDGLYLKMPYLTGASYAAKTASVKAIVIPSGFQNVDSDMMS